MAPVIGALAVCLSAVAQDRPGPDLDLAPNAFHLSFNQYQVAFAEGDPLFVILYSDAPDIWQARKWHMAGPDNAAVSRRGNRRFYSADSFEGKPVRLRVGARMDAPAGEISWDIRVENKSAGTVVGVIGPCLRNVQDRPKGFLAVPNRPGHRIDDPWNTLAKDVQHLTYPVPASMQYLAYSGDGGGVAVHVFDQDMVYKQLAFGGESRQMTPVQYPFVPPGAAWHSPEVLWQVYATDWHAAADRYRAWFQKWARRPEPSPSIKAMPIVPGVVIRARPKEDEFLKDVQKSQEVGTYDAAMPRIEGYARSGRDGVHLVGWFGQGHDSTYPDHLPSDAMGGEAGLLRLAQAIHERKMLAVYYLNARLLNTVTSPSYQAHKEWAAITETGTPRRETIGGQPFDVACPGCAGYREHIKREVLRVASRYGGDGVQLDQIGAAWSVLCFDKSHGHKTPATGWASGHIKMLDDIRKAVRKVNPKFFCWIEGAWEGAGQYVDLSQGGFWPDHPGSKPFPQMYRYTLPAHPLFGDASIGGVPYWCSTDLGRAKRINAAASDFFWKGEFNDNIGLTCATQSGALGTACWFRKGKDLLITVSNQTREPQTYEVSLVRDATAAYDRPKQATALAAGVAVPLQADSTHLTVEVAVPAGQVEAVLLKR